MAHFTRRQALGLAGAAGAGALLAACSSNSSSGGSSSGGGKNLRVWFMQDSVSQKAMD